MIPINYHHLYYFWAAAKAGSISAATERLYLSQSTLSGQLRALEKSCGVKLFERSRKGVALTPQGRVVFGYCERIFAEGDELVAVLKQGCAGPAVLRLGVQPAISRGVVIQILDLARRLDGRIRVAISHDEAEVLADKLRRRALDLVVASDDLAPQLGRDFRSRLVGQIPVFFVASPRLRGHLRRFPADLSRAPMLLRPPENPVRKQVDQYLLQHRVPATLGAVVEDVDLIRRLARDARGVAALSLLAVAADLHGGRLVKLHQAPLGIHERIWLVCARGSGGQGGASALVDALTAKFKVRLEPR